MSDPQGEDEVWQPQDAIAKATSATLIGGSAGLLLASVQNTVAKQNYGAMGVFTKFGGTTAMFASVGGVYAFVAAATANLREKGPHDMVSHAVGGFAGGSICGLRRLTMTSVIGNGLGLATIMAVMAHSYDTVPKTALESEEARIAKKEEARRRFRRPLNELVNEIGEGRGIYPPGYEERRKQRIKERYGIEIQEPFYNREPAKD